MSSPDAAVDRRSAILAAALTAFLDKGYLATSIADIRRLSGATTGSIYHFYSGKPALAEELLRRFVTQWSAQTPVPEGDAEAQIKASVRGLVLWGLANPRELRLLDELRSLAFATEELAGVRELLLTGQSAAAARFAAMQAAGDVRKLPFSIAHALMLGPAYSYLRLAPPTPAAEAERIAALFAEAAWQAVRS